MRIGDRIFLGYFVIVALAAFFVMRVFVRELEPGVRASTEETLVDTVHLLARLAAGDVKAGTVATGHFREAVDAYARQKVEARIGELLKTTVNHRIYVTDARGIVLYDSAGKDVGADYSRWNDVYLTLRGRYGARSTHEDSSNELSSVMYVAAPILDGEKVIGVVSVGKPSASLQPVIESGRRKAIRAGLLLLLLSLGLALAFSYWLSRSVKQVVRYAGDLAAGKRVAQPRLQGELRELGRAVGALREKLDGKTYVEEYVHTLVHELKSPLAAMYGAVELLEGEMSDATRARFVQNIRSEVQRSREILDRLLDLARLEHRRALESRVTVPLHLLAEELRRANGALLSGAELAFENRLPPGLAASGDPFLIRQALNNLIDNAIQFSPRGGVIRLSGTAEGGNVRLRLHNLGAAIPDFAVPRLFERFYSLPRPGTSRKSTGLGLAFVREVALLHGGEITVQNAPEGGVEALLVLPAP